MFTVIKTRDDLMLFCALSVNTRFTAIHHIFTNAIIYFTDVVSFVQFTTVYITPCDVVLSYYL